MSEMKDLETRLETALKRIRGAINAARDGAGNSAGADGAAGRISELEAALKDRDEKLRTLRAERARDVAQLEALIAEVKPLLQEVDNA